MDDDFDFKALLGNINITDPRKTNHAFASPAYEPTTSAAPSRGGSLSGLHPTPSFLQPSWSHGASQLVAMAPPSNLSSSSHPHSLSSSPPTAASDGYLFSSSISNSPPVKPRSESGALLASRLRAASDMHSQGLLTSAEKALMKDLVLSRNPQLRDHYAYAERHKNWGSLQAFIQQQAKEIQAGHFYPHLGLSAFPLATMDDLTHDFHMMGTPPASRLDGSTVHRKKAQERTPTTARQRKGAGAKSSAGGDALRDHLSSAAAAVASSIAAASASPSKPKSTKKHAGGSEKAKGPADPTRPARAAAHTLSGLPTALETDAIPFLSPTKSAKRRSDGDAEDSAAELGEDDLAAKARKNEREKRRRLAVNTAFDDLAEKLGLSLMPSTKEPAAAGPGVKSGHGFTDKCTILVSSLARINELEAELEQLRSFIRERGLAPPALEQPPHFPDSATKEHVGSLQERKDHTGSLQEMKDHAGSLQELIDRDQPPLFPDSATKERSDSLQEMKASADSLQEMKDPAGSLLLPKDRDEVSSSAAKLSEAAEELKDRDEIGSSAAKVSEEAEEPKDRGEISSSAAKESDGAESAAADPMRGARQEASSSL